SMGIVVKTGSSRWFRTMKSSEISSISWACQNTCRLYQKCQNEFRNLGNKELSNPQSIYVLNSLPQGKAVRMAPGDILVFGEVAAGEAYLFKDGKFGKPPKIQTGASKWDKINIYIELNVSPNSNAAELKRARKNWLIKNPGAVNQSEPDKELILSKINSIIEEKTAQETRGRHKRAG
ncbi:MAG: hypothetical protein V1728_01670, partial [Candidatus Micrarchaeota archaeon]